MKDKSIIDKASNREPVRVIYKKSNRQPEVRIIKNILNLKKVIVKYNLNIIPYQDVFIICNNQILSRNTYPNIVLTFSSIWGDLILVKIDRKKREFKGLSQEEIIWYTQDLINKNFNTSTPKSTKKKYTKFYEMNFERDSNSKSVDLEEEILNIATILKNGDMKNE